MFQKIKNFLFKNSSAKQTAAKNTVWLSISNFGGRLIKAVIIIYATRVLGAGQFGLFSYAVTLAAFFTLFVDPGISTVLTREGAKSSVEERRVVFSTTFVMRLCFTIFGCALIFFVAPLFSTLPGAGALLPIVALIMIFDSMRDFFSALFRSMERMEWEAYIFLSMNLATVIAGYFFLRGAANASSFGWGYVIGTATGAIAGLWVARDYVKRVFATFSLERVKSIIQSAWPFAITGALGMLLTNTDILIIGWMKNAVDVGIYAAAIRIVQVVYIIPGLCN